MPTLRDFRQTIENFQQNEQLNDEKLRILQDELTRVQAEEKSQRLKCFFLTKQTKKLSTKLKSKEDDEISTRSESSKATKPFDIGLCPFHAVRGSIDRFHFDFSTWFFVSLVFRNSSRRRRFVQFNIDVFTVSMSQSFTFNRFDFSNGFRMEFVNRL